jgi:hypothetical protein
MVVIPNATGSVNEYTLRSIASSDTIDAVVSAAIYPSTTLVIIFSSLILLTPDPPTPLSYLSLVGALGAILDSPFFYGFAL